MIRRQKIRQILAPATGFRKAVLMAVFGLAIFILGFAVSFKAQIPTGLELISKNVDAIVGSFVDKEGLDWSRHFLGLLMLVAGGYLLVLAFRSGFHHVFATVNPAVGGKVARIYRRRLHLAQGYRIVALGGGTGLSTLLRGLKQHTSNITAIVTVTDDGGSSGRLAQEKGIIPPGDMRNCLVALADAEKAMTDLFQHRFTSDSGSLSGHSVGNLLIAALVDQARGDFEKAIELASDVLNIRGRVVPSTLTHVRLRALLEDGSEICGETKIVESGRRIRRIYLDPENAEAHKTAIDAILEADLICIGPGSVYTSVIPNLLVPGISEALEKSSGKKVYLCNVMTQRGESDSFTASEHVSAIMANVDRRIFDYVMVNTSGPSQSAIEKYRGAGQFVVDPDQDRIRSMGYQPVPGDFMSETDLVRHDPMKIAEGLIRMLEKR